MIPLNISELVDRASTHPFLREHLRMGTSLYRDSAVAHYADFQLGSAYEPIFDISVHALAQSLSSAPQSADRLGDECVPDRMTCVRCTLVEVGLFDAAMTR